MGYEDENKNGNENRPTCVCGFARLLRSRDTNKNIVLDMLNKINGNSSNSINYNDAIDIVVNSIYYTIRANLVKPTHLSFGGAVMIREQKVVRVTQTANGSFRFDVHQMFELKRGSFSEACLYLGKRGQASTQMS